MVTRPEITQRQVKAFLEEKLASADCPTCEENDWNILITPSSGKRGTPVIEIQNEENIAVTRIPAVCMICNNCGFIRLHSRRRIERWIKDRDLSEGMDE